MTFQEFDKLLQRYIDGKCTQEEELLLEKWYRSFEKERPDVLDEQRRTMVEQKLWEKLESNGPQSGQRFMFNWKLGIAATVAAIAVSLYLFFNPFTTDQQKLATVETSENTVISNADPAPFEIKLMDGTTVTLQPGSELTYDAGLFAEAREVHLTGEAFFDVAKDQRHPFLVYSGEITTKVLGTSFRVKAYEDAKEIVVSVSTGKVWVFTQRGDDQNKKEIAQEVILTPDQQAVYSREEDKVARTQVEDPTLVLPEPSAKTFYSNVPVSEVFKVIEKNYGVDIMFNEDTLAACTITTTMGDEGLYEKLEIICQVIGAQFSKQADGVVLIDAPGCN